MRAPFALLILGVLALAPSAARADLNAQLPTTTPCQSGAVPELPAKWRAVAMMMPFLEGQIDIGELVYDSTVPAMRATVHGLESGSVDLLITEKETYRLSGPRDAPTQCQSLGALYRLPPPRWLPEKSVCIGERRLGGRQVETWKAPGAGDQANWHSFRMRTRLPWRNVFTSPSAEHPIVGQYSMSYYPEFAEVKETRLHQLTALCASRAAAPPVERSPEAAHKTPAPPVEPSPEAARKTTSPPPRVPASAAAIHSPRAFMLPADKTADTERRTRVASLVHGVSHEGCKSAKPARWPEHFVMTVTLLPISFADEPTASLIYYDWSGSGGQFAVMFQGRPPTLRGVVGMKKGVGYRLQYQSSGPQCEAVFPGMVRPDWMANAGCQCRAMLKADSPLGLAAPSQIMSCPIKWQPGHVMWSWYTGNGEPVVFFEALARGGGVMLADTHQWLPGAKLPEKNFQLPGACFADDAQRPSSAHGGRFDFPDCGDCHTMR